MHTALLQHSLGSGQAKPQAWRRRGRAWAARAWAARAWAAWALVGLAAQALAQADPPNPPFTVASLSMLSRVEISHQARPPVGPPLLRLQGDAFSGQTVRLTQNGLVFFEQQLSEGSFVINDLRPFEPSSPVSLQLISPNAPDEKAELSLASLQSRTVFARRPELMAPTPITPPKTAATATAKPGQEEDIEFESDFLRGKAFRNLDASAMKKLGQVRPGKIDADIYRNDMPVAKANVLFTAPPNGDEARACIATPLFTQLGVKPEHISPQGQQLLQNTARPDPQACLYMEQWVSGTSAKYDTSELRLDISIPQAFLLRQSRSAVPPGMLTRGENAGFVNYNLNHYVAQNQTSEFLGLNSGINLQGWQVRHTSYLSQSNSASSGSTQQYVAGETFVRRPLIDWKSSLAMGEISSQSPIVGSVPLRGLRMASEEGLMGEDERSYRPVVRGVARTNARVRVQQNGAVFFEQTVPPGPYELNDLNPPSGVGNLTVTLTEADGSVENFLVPYSLSAGKLNPGSARYSLSAGNFRNANGVSDTTVVQAYMRYGLSGFATPGLELLSTQNYQNAGLQMAFNNPWGSLALNRLQSLYQGQGVGGVNAGGYSHSINYSAPALGPLQLFGGVSEQSLGYVSPLSALTDSSLNPYNPLALKNSIYLSMGLSLKSWGGLSLGAVEQNTWTDNQQTHQYRLSYNASLGRVGFSIYLNQTTYANGTPSVDSLGLSASIPLGWLGSASSLRASHNQVGTAQPTQSLSVNGSVGRDNAVGYSVTQSQTGDVGSASASMYYQHPWGTLGMSLSSTNNGASQQGGVSASGGMVVHSDGVIMAPTLGTTFAIVELPKGEGAGVMGSSARINSRGFGVVPHLAAYYINDVQITLEGASTELEVDNASQKVAPVEGSIVRLKFTGTTGRPLLIVLQTQSGRRVPIGASVSDAQGNEVGTVGQGSRALVRVQKPTDRLKVQWGDKPEETCYAQYALGDTQSANASGFTHLKLRCDMTAVPETSAQMGP